MAEQVIHQFDEEHFAVALGRKAMYPAHKACPQPRYDWAKGPVCGCGTPLMGANPPVGGEGEQMGEVDTYLKIPLPDEPGPEARLYLGPGKWYKWMSTTGWEPIDNPDVEPYWGDPVMRWTPLKRGERVMVTGGEHFVNWLGTAQGEMSDGTESVIVDGKDSPWWFSPRYLVRVNDVSDALLEAKVEGTFSNMAQEPIKMGPAHIMHDHMLKPGFAPFPPGAEPYPVPDTDDEHELAAGVYADSEQMNEVEKQQLVLVLPFRNVPNTNACRYIFGDEIQPSRLGEWAALFVKKQIDYGDGADDLGLEGQYAELHRKITKLRRAMWEGHELVGEPLREVLMDLIGHCFLSMMYIDQPRHVRYPKGSKK